MEEVLGYEPTPGDIYALTRWAHLYEIWKSIGERLDDLGPTKADGEEPRKLLSEFRAMSGELSRLEASLGITASARAQLGIDVTRLRRLADDGQDRRPAADVKELEQRIVARLQKPATAAEEPQRREHS